MGIDFKARAYTATYGVRPVQDICLREGYVSLTIPEISFKYRCKNFDLMFSTGWLDMYGKDIYQGDIVKISNHKYLNYPRNIIGYIFKHPVRGNVIRVNEKFRKKYLISYFEYSPKYRIEIIGNIYENKRLLEV